MRVFDLLLLWFESSYYSWKEEGKLYPLSVMLLQFIAEPFPHSFSIHNMLLTFVYCHTLNDSANVGEKAAFLILTDHGGQRLKQHPAVRLFEQL